MSTAGERALAASARRELATLSEEPRHGRQQLAAALRRVVPADLAFEYRGVQSRAGWVLSADFVIDGEDWGAGFSQYVGHPLNRKDHSYDPELPEGAEVNRFIGVGRRQRRAPVYGAYYARHGLQQLRTLAYDGSRFLGWFGLLRGPDRPPFTEADRRALDQLAPTVASTLAAAHRLEQAAIDGVAPGHLVFTPGGALLQATEEAGSWLTADRRTFLSDFVRRVDRGGADATILDGAELAVRRLVGERSVYLVNLGRARLPRRSILATLTERRRQIAEYAAAGATAKEIAETLGISAHTARQHLKGIYRELGVGSRVELARMVEERGALSSPR